MSICRTCLKTKPKDKCTNISPNEDNEEICHLLEMISYSIPELDVFVVMDPVICESCIATLEVSFKFKMECLKNQERLLKYSNSTNPKVDLHSIYGRIRKPQKYREYNNNDKESTIKKPLTALNKQLPKKEGQQGSLSCEKCPGCELKVTSDPSLHSKTNNGAFICYHCNRKMDDISKLRKHILGHVRQRRCKICNKSFRDLDNLKRHLRVHTHANPFKCHICLKEFRQKHNLTQHINQHVRSEKLTCSHCQKVFSTKYNLKVHMKNTHRQKQFCDLCGEGFSTKSELVEHLHTTTEKCGSVLKPKKEIKQENQYEQDIPEGEIKVDPETVSESNVDPSVDQLLHDGYVDVDNYSDVNYKDIKPFYFKQNCLTEESSRSDADIDIVN